MVGVEVASSFLLTVPDFTAVVMDRSVGRAAGLLCCPSHPPPPHPRTCAQTTSAWQRADGREFGMEDRQTERETERDEDI